MGVRLLKPVILLVLLALAMGAWFVVQISTDPQTQPIEGAPQVGHVIRAYGTVKMTPGIRRVSTQGEVRVPLSIGQSIQTGEDSAALVLFFGGSKLQIEAGSVVSLGEEEGDQVTLRLLMGRSFLEIADTGAKFQFLDQDGRKMASTESKRILLTLNALHTPGDAVEVREIVSKNSKASSAELERLELRASAHGEEVDENYALIVPPIEDSGVDPVIGSKYATGLRAPRPHHPENDSWVDVTDVQMPFRWLAQADRRTAAAANEDPVVGYEVTVRPAFGYEVEEYANRHHVLKTATLEAPMAPIHGTGTFLWQVRPVTAKGWRGPASEPRWVELKFPRILFAPVLKKPKIK